MWHLVVRNRTTDPESKFGSHCVVDVFVVLLSLLHKILKPLSNLSGEPTVAAILPRRLRFESHLKSKIFSKC